MTKQEKHAIRKKYKEYKQRRTDCRERKDMLYYRGWFTSSRYTVLIRNSAYYEYEYDVIIYNKYTKKIVQKDSWNRESAFRLAMFYLADNYRVSYDKEYKWI